MTDKPDILFTAGEDLSAGDAVYLDRRDGLLKRVVSQEEEPERVIKPHKCSDPNLESHCTGCTDSRSEGTHQGCTKEHGHVGCDQVIYDK